MSRYSTAGQVRVRNTMSVAVNLSLFLVVGSWLQPLSLQPLGIFWHYICLLFTATATTYKNMLSAGSTVSKNNLLTTRRQRKVARLFQAGHTKATSTQIGTHDNNCVQTGSSECTTHWTMKQRGLQQQRTPDSHEQDNGATVGMWWQKHGWLKSGKVDWHDKSPFQMES